MSVDLVVRHLARSSRLGEFTTSAIAIARSPPQQDRDISLLKDGEGSPIHGLNPELSL
jgi:hypothetical protein